MHNPVDVILGLQWGDEGKGKIVDCLTAAGTYQMVCRFQGGPNAGHTLVIGGHKTVLHTIPSGIMHPEVINLIGNGVVIDPVTLEEEAGSLKAHGVDVTKNLYVSQRAHLILPTHKMLDAASESSKGEGKIGSTLRGIGPAYMDKTGRNGLRAGVIHSKSFDAQYKALTAKHMKLLGLYGNYPVDKEQEEKLFRGIEFLRGLKMVDGPYFVNEKITQGKRVLAEGAQGAMLDIDFGTYPYVTSSNTTTAAVCKGLGIPPHLIGEVTGVFKAYCTRVGGGPFPTELTDDSGEMLRKIGGEYGSTTGRPRRCGWIDLPALSFTIMLNGVTKLAMTKVDVLNTFSTIKACQAYLVDGKETTRVPFDMDESGVKAVYKSFKGWESGLGADSGLPLRLNEYIGFIEDHLKVPVGIISIGPEREETIYTHHPTLLS